MAPCYAAAVSAGEGENEYMGNGQDQPTQDQLDRIHDSQWRLGFYVYFFNGHPGPPWEGGLLFAVQSGPGGRSQPRYSNGL